MNNKLHPNTAGSHSSQTRTPSPSRQRTGTAANVTSTPTRRAEASTPTKKAEAIAAQLSSEIVLFKKVNHTSSDKGKSIYEKFCEACPSLRQFIAMGVLLGTKLTFLVLLASLAAEAEDPQAAQSTIEALQKILLLNFK